MTNRFSRLVAATFGIVGGGVVLSRIRANPPPDTVESSARLDPLRDSEAGRLLHRFFVAMNGVGDDAQAAYEEALAALRARAEAIVAEIAHAERTVDTDDYVTRWALIHAAAELRHPAALPLLRDLVRQRIPPERSPDPHSLSTVAEETILRTTAVEGVEYLAVDGNDEAREALFGFLEQPSLSIRRASVQGILATSGGDALRGRVAALLPADQQFILDIKRVDVRAVPQIEDPTRHLAQAARPLTDPSPRLPDQGNGPGRETESPQRPADGNDAPRVR